jgi:hypothetical protein
MTPSGDPGGWRPPVAGVRFESRERERSVSTDFQYDIPDGSPSLEAILVKDEEAREVVAAFDTQRGLPTTALPVDCGPAHEVRDFRAHQQADRQLGADQIQVSRAAQSILSTRISGAGSDSFESGDDAQ